MRPLSESGRWGDRLGDFIDYNAMKQTPEYRARKRRGSLLPTTGKEGGLSAQVARAGVVVNCSREMFS